MLLDWFNTTLICKKKRLCYSIRMPKKVVSKKRPLLSNPGFPIPSMCLGRDICLSREMEDTSKTVNLIQKRKRKVKFYEFEGMMLDWHKLQIVKDRIIIIRIPTPLRDTLWSNRRRLWENQLVKKDDI